jgi:hypothetical protein
MVPAIAPANAYLRRFTVDEYHRMIDVGILTEDDPVELLEGWVRYKMPRNPLHDSRIDVARRALERLLPSSWWVRIQSAITLSDSEPEPDLAVVPGPPERYDGHHPGAAEITTLVEVANTTLDFDRDEKGCVYARERIPCYWIVNLIDGQVEVYTDPSGPDPAPAYRQRQDFRPGDAVPLVLGGQTAGTIRVQDLLP